MADTSILKEFLVSLGFKVDTSSETKFKETVKAGTERIKEFGTAMTATATVAVAGITKIASSLEDLYFASQRTKASGENIKAFEFAVSQLGGTADGARGSLESLARNLRNSPGFYGMIEGLGVHTKDANGQLRDTVDIVQDLGTKLASMPYYQANSYANALGIDEKTLMAMRDGSLVAQMQRYKEMRDAVGLDGNEGEKSGHDFMVEMRNFGTMMLLLLQKVGISLATVVLPGLRGLNMLVLGAVQWFGRLDPSVKTVLKVMLGLVAAWAAMATVTGLWLKFKPIEMVLNLAKAIWGLNAAMLANPAGIIVVGIAALAAAIALLWDDYQTWRNGGQSLIPWETWGKEIDAALNKISALVSKIEILQRAVDKINDLRIVDKTMKLITGEDTPDEKAAKALEPTKPKAAPATPAKPADAPPAPANGKALPRGIRNNNPGNLNYVGQAGAMKEAGPNGRFAVFRNAQEGLDALAKQLQLYAKRGLNSVSQMIGKFAPPNENNTKAYIERVSKALGVSSTDALNMKDPKVVQTMMDAIIKVENGRNPYSREMVAASAAKGVPAPTVNQTTNVTVNGATQPQETARAVTSAQNDVNAMMVRNLKTPAR